MTASDPLCRERSLIGVNDAKNVGGLMEAPVIRAKATRRPVDRHVM
jgi:hypothetical protein